MTAGAKLASEFFPVALRSGFASLRLCFEFFRCIRRDARATLKRIGSLAAVQALRLFVKAVHGFSGKKFFARGKVIALADTPRGKQARDFGCGQTFQEDGGRFLDGRLFVLDLDAHNCCWLNCKTKSSGFKTAILPAYRRMSRSSQVR